MLVWLDMVAQRPSQNLTPSIEKAVRPGIPSTPRSYVRVTCHFCWVRLEIPPPSLRLSYLSYLFLCNLVLSLLILSQLLIFHQKLLELNRLGAKIHIRLKAKKGSPSPAFFP